MHRSTINYKTRIQMYHLGFPQTKLPILINFSFSHITSKVQNNPGVN